MSDLADKAQNAFQIGKLNAERGEFFLAIDQLSEASKLFAESKAFRPMLDAINLLLRLYAETDQQEQISVTKENLQDFVLKEGIEISSRVYYTLGLSASYRGQEEVALEYLQKSLSLALASDNKEDMCYAISGLAIVYAGLRRYDDALREIYNLQIFFEVIQLPEVKAASQMLNAWILRETNRCDAALEVLWKAHETMRETKTLTGHINILFSLGKTYFKAGQTDLAKLYLQLAMRVVDPKNMIRLARQIQNSLEEAGAQVQKDFDLIFELEEHAVQERRLGRVDFKNQFILLDLLKLFVQNQGHVYTKEDLVQHVWKQSYDPRLHDNKIYVTIKRLRKMIEPDFDKPKYIFRAKNGYFMNRSARVLLEKQQGDA